MTNELSAQAVFYLEHKLIERHMCAGSFKEIAERRVTDAEE